MYKFKLYKPRKNWFSKLVWIEDLHKKEIGSKISDSFDYVVDAYEAEMKRWS